jgi:hypothetical protein
MSNLYRWPSKDASYQVSIHLAKWLLTDFVCLYNYEFWLSLCKIARSSVILLLPLFRGEDFFKSANQKQELPMVAMFVNGSELNEQSL